MAWLLERHLSGLNEVVEADSNIKDEPGISGFKDFLTENGLCSHKALLELGQALKVSCEDMIKLGTSKEGYITGDARNNIIYYLENVGRISPPLLQFLQSQQGNCGQLNSYNWKDGD
ncbi:MAG: hypothetical protein WCX27_02040 [Candidatus Paceibacterota bacterium]|jgi:hypothetical protein